MTGAAVPSFFVLASRPARPAPRHITEIFSARIRSGTDQPVVPVHQRCHGHRHDHREAAAYTDPPAIPDAAKLGRDVGTGSWFSWHQAVDLRRQRHRLCSAGPRPMTAPTTRSPASRSTQRPFQLLPAARARSAEPAHISMTPVISPPRANSQTSSCRPKKTSNVTIVDQGTSLTFTVTNATDTAPDALQRRSQTPTRPGNNPRSSFRRTGARRAHVDLHTLQRQPDRHHRTGTSGPGSSLTRSIELNSFDAGANRRTD